MKQVAGAVILLLGSAGVGAAIATFAVDFIRFRALMKRADEELRNRKERHG